MRHLGPFAALVAALIVATYAATGIGLALATASSPPVSPGTATTETLGGILRTDGWCVSATTTAQDVWALAPARISTATKSQVRFVTLRYSDRTSVGDVCTRLDAATVSRGDAGTANLHVLLCDGGSNTSGMMSTNGEFQSFAISRDQVTGTPPASPAAGPPKLWVLATATTTVCVTVAW